MLNNLLLGQPLSWLACSTFLGNYSQESSWIKQNGRQWSFLWLAMSSCSYHTYHWGHCHIGPFPTCTRNGLFWPPAPSSVADLSSFSFQPSHECITWSFYKPMQLILQPSYQVLAYAICAKNKILQADINCRTVDICKLLGNVPRSKHRGHSDRQFWLSGNSTFLLRIILSDIVNR